MAHDHHHEEDDLYYLGQLGLVFFTALYAAFALALSLHWTSVLNRLLAKHLQPYLLWSGLVLMVFAIARGCALWVAVGKSSDEANANESDEDITTHDVDDTIVHEPGSAATNESDEAATLHEEATGIIAKDEMHHHHHDDSDHDHHHHHDDSGDHHHHHDGGHDHSHEDHEHGWEPMRYLVLALAIGLFFLLYFWGLLPFMAPQIGAMDFDKDLKVNADHTKEAVHYASILMMGPSFAQLGTANVLINEPVEEISFQALLTIQGNSYAHGRWRGKMLRIWGQFGATPNDTRFGLVRFRMQCCGADAQPVPIPVISSTPITGFRNEEWIKITARVEFGTLQGQTTAILRVSDSLSIKRAPRDPDPYIQ